MTADTLQPLLFSLDGFEERHKREFPLLVFFIDSTPSYDVPLLMEKYETILAGNKHEMFLPKENQTPGNLLYPPNFQIARITANSIQRSLEATGSKTFTPSINMIFETPISSIAWTLYEKTTNGPTEETKTLLDVNRSILATIAKGLKQISSEHIVRILPPEKVLNVDLSHLSPEEISQLKSKITIFNGCLRTATKIGSECLGKDIKIVTA